MTKTAPLLAALALITFAGTAYAGGNDLGSSERPWAQGVSSEEQHAALELFSKGNGDLKNSYFLEAANAYREALKHWDHPAIHYNLVLALLNLDQPVEVHEHLEAAMKYGAAPLDEDKLAQAKRYKSLVEKQLTHVSLTCNETGAKVVMDGKDLFTAPGHYDGWVRAGPHTIVASKEGFLPNQISKPLPPGESVSYDMKLFTEDDLTQYKRMWSAWVPWAVVGAGVAVAGIGGAMHFEASQSYKSFDSDIQTCGGCVPSSSTAAKKNTGNTLQSAAFGAYGVGGAAIVTGAVLVYVNRLQPFHLNPGDEHVEVGMAPYVAPGQAGFTMAARF